jgi:hypothetical protein
MVQSAPKVLTIDEFISRYGECDRYELIDGSHSNLLQHYIARCRGTAHGTAVPLLTGVPHASKNPHIGIRFDL